jgi:hypothetical protein
MFRGWFIKHFKLFGTLLMALAALNGWMAYAVFLQHPVVAFANGAMALVIVLGVVLFWRAGERG